MVRCAIQPMSCWEALGDFLFSQIHAAVVTTPSAFDASKQCGCKVSTVVLLFYLRLVAYSFFWLALPPVSRARVSIAIWSKARSEYPSWIGLP
jgi:hypothetical protein